MEIGQGVMHDFWGSSKKLEKLMNRIKELEQHNTQYNSCKQVKNIERKIRHLLLDEEIL